MFSRLFGFPRLKTILLAFTMFAGLCLTLVIISPAQAFFGFEDKLKEKLDAKNLLPTTEYYAAPFEFKLHQTYKPQDVQSSLLTLHYRLRESNQRLLKGDFAQATAEEVEKLKARTATVSFAFFIQPKESESYFILSFNDKFELIEIFNSANNLNVDRLTLEADLIAQYVGQEPIMQDEVLLNQVPPMCLNAIMAIEDQRFLEHGGVSATGILRAIGKNILTGRKAQGGSTITQQLVKNYFLSSERTFKRKIQEIAMAVMLESKFTKDEILGTYLNIIYMGQNGAFQVRGYGSASKYYFNKNISELNTSECALMAAIVNSPGLFNPFKKPENATKRRHLVLQKMLDLKFINSSQFDDANKMPLPSSTKAIAAETAPYYLDAVRKQLAKQNISIEGAKIYTQLSTTEQQWAQDALLEHLGQLEKNNKRIKALKAKGKSLEGIVLSLDRQTGLVSTAVGGRGYRLTQFNRITDAHRQIGSIMKPLVYLTALSTKENDHPKYNPLTSVMDEAFTVSYDGQKWSPENYEKTFSGKIPLAFGLKNSLNAATAKLAMDIGLENIIDIANKLGATSKLEKVPSLSLGAFELYPTEVAQIYLNLANFGKSKNLSFVRKVMDAKGAIVFEQNSTDQILTDTKSTAVLVSMMKQTLISGTAKVIPALGFKKPAAGKTGTTSDYRDAWFVGFTPNRVTLVWLGYDDNDKTSLTGASGAAPVWANFMIKATANESEDDFTWPEGTIQKNSNEMDLLFEKGTEP